MTKTNKLPEIGKRYKHKRYPGQECHVINITNERVVYEAIYPDDLKHPIRINSYAKSIVWNMFEELTNPEPTPVENGVESQDNLETEPRPVTMDDSIRIRYALPKKAQEAVEELKEELTLCQNNHDWFYSDVELAAKRLVKTLEEQQEDPDINEIADSREGEDNNISNSTPLDVDKIIEDLVYDITDRRGLKHEFNNIDDDIKEEMLNKWRRIIIQNIYEPSSEPDDHMEKLKDSTKRFTEFCVGARAVETIEPITPKKPTSSIWKPISELRDKLLKCSMQGRDSNKIEICEALLELEKRIERLENE